MRRGFLSNKKASNSGSTEARRSQRRSSALEHATPHSENTGPLRSERRYSAPEHVTYTTTSGSKYRNSAPEHEVFCLMASRLSYLTGEAPSLQLCRNQERLAARIYHKHLAVFEVFFKHLPPYEPSSTLIGMILKSNRQPTRFAMNYLCFATRIPNSHTISMFFPSGDWSRFFCLECFKLRHPRSCQRKLIAALARASEQSPDKTGLCFRAEY